jgi:hypothetical protein
MADNENIPVRAKGESNEDYIERLKGILFQKPKEKNAAFNARVRNIVAKQKAEEAKQKAEEAKKEANEKKTRNGVIDAAKALFSAAPLEANGNAYRNAAIATLKATGFNATNYEGHAATIKQRREFAAAEEAQRQRAAEERARLKEKELAEEVALFDELVKLYRGALGKEEAERWVNMLLDAKLRSGYYYGMTISEVYRIMIGEKILEDEEIAKRKAERNAYYKKAAASGASAAQGGPRAASPPAANAWKYKTSTNWTPAAPAIYPILGIPVTSTKSEIAKQFRQLALKSDKYKHPNHGGNTAKFQELQAEYDRAITAAIGGKRKTRRVQKSRRKTKRRS